VHGAIRYRKVHGTGIISEENQDMMDTITAEMLLSHSTIQQKLNITTISDKESHNYRLTGKME
jgi:hypothetical protein